MKKYLFLIAILSLCALSSNAQSFKDTFDSNSMGWTETSGKNTEAIIKDGVMYLKSKETVAITSTYLNFDVQSNFIIKCNANIKKINEGNPIGIVFNYIDDYNYCAFAIDEGYTYFYEIRDSKIVGYRENDLKIKDRKKASIDFSLKSTYNKIQFEVNNMTAIELRFKPIISTGFGFYVSGKQEVRFDNLEVIQ